ncbi:MAG: helix-turn-helix domain-containing protein [Nitrospinota bacterium]
MSLGHTGDEAEPPLLSPAGAERTAPTERPSGRGPKTSSKETLGEIIRRRREAKGITVEQLADTTKIKERILIAIEEDRYDQTLPVPVVRGFLRTIASELGLRPATILTRFEQMGIKGEVEQVFPKWTAQLKPLKRKSRSWISTVTAVFLVLGLGYLFLTVDWNLMLGWTGDTPDGEVEGPAGSGESGSEPAQGAFRAEKTLASNGGAGQDTSRTTPSNHTSEEPSRAGNGHGLAGSSGSQDVRAAKLNGGEFGWLQDSSVELPNRQDAKPDNRPLFLKVTAKEDTWLRVIVDGRRRDESFLLEGESRRWEGEKTFVLTVGNAANTSVELNGLTIQLPKTKSNLVRDFLISKKNLP